MGLDPDPTKNSLDIKSLGRQEALGEIERAVEDGRIYAVTQIRDQLTAMIPKGIHNTTEVELLRYAERALGILVRRGQTGPDRWITGNWSGNVGANPDAGMRSAMDFFISVQERSAAFKMADDVTDEQFAAAIERCKANGSMARARIIEALEKKVPDWVVSYDRPEVLRKRRLVDMDRVIEQSIGQLEAVFASLDSIITNKDMYSQISSADAARWANEVDLLVGKTRRFRDNIKKGQINSGS